MKLLTVILLVILTVWPGFKMVLAIQTGQQRRYVLAAVNYRPGRYYVSLERRQ